MYSVHVHVCTFACAQFITLYICMGTVTVGLHLITLIDITCTCMSTSHQSFTIRCDMTSYWRPVVHVHVYVFYKVECYYSRDIFNIPLFTAPKMKKKWYVHVHVRAGRCVFALCVLTSAYVMQMFLFY